VDPATQVTTKVALEVTIPGAGNVTGQAFNSFGAGAFQGDSFLFVSQDGTVSGWRGALGTTAEVLQSASPDTVYTGVTLDVTGGHAYLLEANFLAGKIDVFKGDPSDPALAGNFTDPGLPADYAPFNVQKLGTDIFVAYAKVNNPNTGEEVAGPGFGFVSRFDLQGSFVARVGSAGTLNAPWGLAIAPTSFGDLAGNLLVGNFGDGRVNAFDIATDTFKGQLQLTGGTPLEIDGLWALTPGNDGNGGSSQNIYFTAGPDEETHGLFGVLTVAEIPEPGVSAVMLTLLASIAGLAYRRAHRNG
jgi:uncharacterized protein (TIGR03118 family)